MRYDPAMHVPLKALLLFLIVQVALGQHMNSPEGPCQKPATTVETANCFDRVLKNADGNLQHFYEKLKEKLPADDFSRLQVAQRLWLKYRDANCAAEYNLYGGGTAGPVAHLACLEADTRARIAELHTIYDWQLKK